MSLSFFSHTHTIDAVDVSVSRNKSLRKRVGNGGGGGDAKNNGERDQTVGSFGTFGADSRKTNP